MWNGSRTQLATTWLKLAMNEATDDLPEALTIQANLLVQRIEQAGSFIIALKEGARADGFVLGLACSGAITDEHCNLLNSQFDKAVENRLRYLTLGL